MRVVVRIKDGIVQDVYRGNDAGKRLMGEAILHVDYGDAVVSPGLIDAHVHFNEPGDDTREGIRTGTRAAVTGGITTTIDMPTETRPPTDTCQRLKCKILRFKTESLSNIGAWAGLTSKNIHDRDVLQCMIQNCNAFGFFSSLNTTNGHLSGLHSDHLFEAMTIANDWGLPFALYIPEQNLKTEIPHVIDLLQELKLKNFKSGFRLHFVRIVDIEALAFVQEAKRNGLPVSIETSPHYLHYSRQEAAGKPLLKTEPGIASKTIRDQLWSMVRRGEVDIVASDHRPAVPKEKSSSTEAVAGITGLQYTLPVVWTGLSQGTTSNASLMQLSRLTSQSPAELLKLAAKGKLSPGMDADFVVWNPEAYADTSKRGCRMRHPTNSPYLNAQLKGQVLATWLAGNRIYDKQRGLAWRSCRRVYGLGDWAKVVIMWFYERSFME